MKNKVIAIDGHSGCGKSTTAKAVAARLGFKYLDSGAMYRAVTLYFLRHNVNISDDLEVTQALNNIKLDFIYSDFKQRYETILNGDNVEDNIRKSEISDKVSEISALPPVRFALIDKQRQLAKEGSIVMDGRDIGTTVFPDADLKIFMTADIVERARRRKLDLENIGDQTSIESIIANLQERDHKDMSRAVSPLRKADDAIEIDTSKLTFTEQVKKIVKIAVEKLNIQA
ncbi:MAG: (d)CMP kinase [Cyclobacteriaceae bacterium]